MKLSLKILFTVYLLLLIWLVLFKLRYGLPAITGRSLNFVPLAASAGKREIMENFVAFIPFGIFLTLTAKKLTFGQRLLIILASSLSAEIIQYIFAIGATDITDVLSNTTGGLIGLLIALPFKKSKTFERLVLVLGTLIIVGLLVLRVRIRLNLK